MTSPEKRSDTVQQIAELYSISGQYDLLVKCYLPSRDGCGPAS